MDVKPSDEALAGSDEAGAHHGPRRPGDGALKPEIALTFESRHGKDGDHPGDHSGSGTSSEFMEMSQKWCHFNEASPGAHRSSWRARLLHLLYAYRNRLGAHLKSLVSPQHMELR